MMSPSALPARVVLLTAAAFFERMSSFAGVSRSGPQFFVGFRLRLQSQWL